MADAGSSSTPVAEQFKYDDDNIADNADEISEAAFGNEVEEEEQQQHGQQTPREEVQGCGSQRGAYKKYE